jgi:hypothetical protein
MILDQAKEAASWKICLRGSTLLFLLGGILLSQIFVLP